MTLLVFSFTFIIILGFTKCSEEQHVSDDIKNVASIKSNFINLEKVKRQAESEVKKDINKFEDSKAANILNMYNFVRDPAIAKLIRSEISKSQQKKPFTSLNLKRSLDIAKLKGNNRSARMFLKLCLKGAREERMVKRLCKRMTILDDLTGEKGDESVADDVQTLLTHLYEAEAKVQIEANEVVRLQQIAAAAQHGLEEATNKVRILSAELQAEQNATNILAENAHNVQLELANHDQLLYEARQKVSELSNQMVELEESLAGNAIADISITSAPKHAAEEEAEEKGDVEKEEKEEEEKVELPQMHCFGLGCI